MAYEPVAFSQGYYTTHDCASVLKSLIGDLSEPLLQERLFNAHLHSLGGFESLISIIMELHTIASLEFLRGGELCYGHK